MYSIYNAWTEIANVLFAISLVSLIVSLIISLIEIFLSTSALEVLLSEVEGISEQTLLEKVLHMKSDHEKD